MESKKDYKLSSLRIGNNMPVNIVKPVSSVNSVKSNPNNRVTTDMIINTVINNKMTFGTNQMMENERLHAEEAINSGIYITWSSSLSSNNKKIECFRVGSNSMCICNHGFNSHEKILSKKKQSSKCKSCKCKAFTYVPLFPEEIGEYWLPHRKDFKYSSWKAKCKCNHTWNEHSAELFLSCLRCNCFKLDSNFCCVVCDKFWQDHEMQWELEHERYMEGKPIGQEFVPFNEMPEMYNILYKK